MKLLIYIRTAVCSCCNSRVYIRSSSFLYRETRWCSSVAARNRPLLRTIGLLQRRRRLVVIDLRSVSLSVFCLRLCYSSTSFTVIKPRASLALFFLIRMCKAVGEMAQSPLIVDNNR